MPVHLFSGFFNVARNPVTNRHIPSLRRARAKVKVTPHPRALVTAPDMANLARQ